MVITRKIEVVISKDATSKEKQEYIHQLYTWRDLIRKAANCIVSHKFVQQNIKDFTYIQEDFMQRFMELNPDAKDKNGDPKFFVKDILKDEKGCSEQNVTYRVAAAMLNGKCPSVFTTCLNQAVSKTYKEKIVDFLIGKASVPSYRNIPIPFPAIKFEDLKVSDRTYKDSETGKEKTVSIVSLDFYHIPIELFFGKDRSNNRVIIERAMSGEYKFCGSSLMIDDDKKKMFLLVCVDIPKKEVELNEKKCLYAILDFETPIICSTNKDLPELGEETKGAYKIGNKEEYLHRRLAIQAALRRLQIACKYNEGGNGRKNKLKAIERFKAAEKNYIDSKMHVYSKILVEQAVKSKCGVIHLANFKAIEDTVNEQPEEKKHFLIRNWSYHALTTKIKYKAKRYGIKVTQEAQTEEEN